MSEKDSLKIVVEDDKDDIEIINEDNIIDIILNLMEKVENFSEMNGTNKKQYVLKSIKILLGVEPYKRYSYFISSFIDFVVNVSKGKKININKVKNKFCCF